MSSAPGRWVGGSGSLSVGFPADIALVDLSEEWTVDRDTMASKSSNSPYVGKAMTSRIVGTIVGGEVIHDTHDIFTGAKFGIRA
jgi:dihydroorotase